MKISLMAVFFALATLYAGHSHAAPTAETQANKSLTAPAPEENLLDDKIYFFVHSLCQNCRHAYVYLNTLHADLNIPFTDMKFHHNLELYKQCVKKFNISNKELTLPLICMGDKYIMGWDKNFPEKFEQALIAFQAKAK